MSAAIFLVLIVAIAYLATHVVFDWLARRFLIVSGAEYLLLGLLLGPQVSGLLSADTVQSFAPLTTLALGWIGAIVGTQFYLPELVRIPGVVYRTAFGEAVATLLVVGALELVALHWLFGLAWWDVAPPAIALAAIATASAPAGIEVVARRLGRRGAITQLLQVTTAVDALVAISAMGLLLCLHHAPVPLLLRSPTSTEWAVITVGVGVVGGALFHLFLGGEREVDRLVISLAGAVILVSGAAAYLRLSPLFPSMIVGAILVNTSANRDEIARILYNAERPFYFVLLVFAGTEWQPSTRAWVLPVLLFLVARAAGKIGGARLSSRLSGALEGSGVHWGRALLGQGGLAVALAVDYLHRPGSLAPYIVFTAAIVSVLLTDFSSARLIQSVMQPLLRERTDRFTGSFRVLRRGAAAPPDDDAGDA